MPRKIDRKAFKDQLMVKARDFAKSGSCIGWRDVVRKFEGNDEATLRIWLTVRDMDELDRLCDEAREKVSKGTR